MTHQIFPGDGVAKIGLGGVTFGREIDAEASFVLMDYALEKGIRFFDTAAAYGSGASETIIGKWLRANPAASEAVFVATKILPPYEPGLLSASVDRCRYRLGRDTLDLLYLHRWDHSLQTPEALKALQRLVSEGKIRWLGASNFSSAQLAAVRARQEKEGWDAFRYVQQNHNLAVSDLDGQMISLCLRQGIRIVTYSPLAAGFLTGKYRQGIVGEGSRFDIIRGHRDIYFNAPAQARLEKLLHVSAGTGHSPVHLALAWALHQPFVDHVLIGGRHTGHIDQALAALSLNDPVIFRELEASSYPSKGGA